MLTELTVENYRGFERYRLPELRRVNLLVGRNNCGKTSLLEAVRLFARKGYPDDLKYIALDRGEVTFVDEPERPEGGRYFPAVSHFFRNRQFQLGQELVIQGSESELLRISVSTFDSVDTSGDYEELVQQLLRRSSSPTETLLWSEFACATKVASIFAIPLSTKGTIGFPTGPGRPRWAAMQTDGHTVSTNVEFISPGSLEPMLMGEMWDWAVETGDEESVVDAMKLLEPRLQSIHFLSAEHMYRHSRSGVLLGFEGERRRVPLGSHGDGMRRMLALALSLTHTSGGYLLVDEIDTGLHWTVMADMWRLVIETARRNNTQVFATTHSLDCLRGLDQACREYPHLAEDVSAHTIDPTLEESVFMSAGDLRIALEQEIEVR